MLNFGTVKPGSTIRIPFSSFDKDDGSSITMTNYAAADILIYKDGNTTERASTSGFTATTDFDGKTGKHLAIIDLADNTTADFYASGSDYLVAIDAVTIDGVTTGAWIARFSIGYTGANLDTTIASLSSQTSFTLTSGPAEDDALNGHWAVIHDAASAVQRSTVLILDYTGSTKTVTLAAGATFTVAAKDNISVMDVAPLQPSTLGRTLDVSTGGEAGLDWANIGSPTTAQNLSATNIDVDQVVASVSGAVGSVTGNVGGNVTGSVGSVAAGGITASSIAADAIGASELAADAAAEIAAAVRTELTTELGRVDVAVSTRASQTSVDTIDDFVDTEVAAIKAKTDNLPSDPADASDIAAAFGTVNATLATIASYVDTEVAAIKAVTDKLDTTVEVTSDATYIFTADALQNAPTSGGTAPTAAEIADAVWEEAIADHSGTSGSTAEALAAAGSAGDPWITALPGAYSAGQAGYILGTNLDVVVSTRASQASVDVIDGIVDSILTDTAEIGAAGAGLTALATQASLNTIDGIVDAILVDTAEIGAAGAGLTALASAANLATVAGYIDTEVAAILADTNELQTDWANGGRLDNILDARASQTSVDDLPTNAELATALGAADDAVLAQVALVKAKTDNLPSDPADASDIATAFAAVPAAVWQRVIDGTYTAEELLRVITAFAAGKTSGFEVLEPVFRNLADDKDVIVGEQDSSGNRTTVTVDVSA